jgi:hypothetical protein
MSDTLPSLDGEDSTELICLQCQDCGACSIWHDRDDHLIHIDWTFTHRFKTGHQNGYWMWTARRDGEARTWEE